jgi:uncharacterized protein YndB with AHSA1/START domain
LAVFSCASTAKDIVVAHVAPFGGPLAASGRAFNLGALITTVTFEEKAGQTLLVMHDLYPSKEALDEGSGSTDGMGETFNQLDELLIAQGAVE